MHNNSSAFTEEAFATQQFAQFQKGLIAWQLFQKDGYILNTIHQFADMFDAFSSKGIF